MEDIRGTVIQKGINPEPDSEGTLKNLEHLTCKIIKILFHVSNILIIKNFMIESIIDFLKNKRRRIRNDL